MTEKGFGGLLLASVLGLALFGGVVAYKTHEAVTTAGRSFGIVAKGIARANQAHAGTSLPFQSIDIAVEGNHIVRTDNKPHVWPTVVRSTKADRGVMPDDQEVGDLIDADLAIEEKNSSKHMLARLQ